MAKKRKTRSTETTQDPEPTQQSDPEPQPEPEPITEPEPVTEPEQITEQEEEVTEEEIEEEVEEEEEESEEEEEETKNDTVSETTENPDAKPSEVLNGVENEADLDEEPLEKVLEPFSKDQLSLLIKESMTKHPDIIELVRKLADSDPAHRKIFVHGLGWEATSETITSVYAKYGEIEDCKVVKDNLTGKSKGYGFILFKHRDGARRALKEPQKLIDGRMTSCQLASAGPVKGNVTNTSNVSVSGPPMSEYTMRKIYVSNVSAELDPDKLTEYFAQFGEIEEGPLGLDKTTGKPRGFCLFVYKSVESARKALVEPHKNYEGQTLHCQQAVDGPKHSKSGGQQSHHQGSSGYGHVAKKGRFSGGGHRGGHGQGHLMAPGARPVGNSMGYNPAVAPAAIGQAVAALLAAQGGGLGIGNLLGGIGGGMNHQQGVPPMMNNAGYGGQPGMQGGYGGQPGYGGPQMGQPGVRPPHQGGAPYMGHGR